MASTDYIFLKSISNPKKHLLFSSIFEGLGNQRTFNIKGRRVPIFILKNKFENISNCHPGAHHQPKPISLEGRRHPLLHKKIHRASQFHQNLLQKSNILQWILCVKSILLSYHQYKTVSGKKRSTHRLWDYLLVWEWGGLCGWKKKCDEVCCWSYGNVWEEVH